RVPGGRPRLRPGQARDRARRRAWHGGGARRGTARDRSGAAGDTVAVAVARLARSRDAAHVLLGNRELLGSGRNRRRWRRYAATGDAEARSAAHSACCVPAVVLTAADCGGLPLAGPRGA